MRGRSDRAGSRPAFTLIELLVVIGIIAVLIALLLPAIGGMHRAANDANTRNEVNQIATACESYYQDFRAYPGPISNQDIEVPTTTGWTAPVDTYHDPSGGNGQGGLSMAGPRAGPQSINPINGQQMYFTSSENLVFGLLGGLWNNPVTPYYLQYVNGSTAAGSTIPNTLVGTGPRNLAAAGTTSNAGKQYSAYMSINFPGSPLFLNGDGSLQSGRVPYFYGPVDSTGKQPIMFRDYISPVFTDQYPDPMPILYIRAQPGAHGVISGPKSYGSSIALVNDPTLPSTALSMTAHYNYDLSELTPYTYPNDPASGSTPSPSTSAGVGLSGSKGILLNGMMPQHGLQGVSGGGGSYPGVLLPVYPVAVQTGMDKPVPTNTPDNAGEYFLNAGIVPGNIAGPPKNDYINATGSPRNKDGFILISAGRDRVYGTADDITNFGDVEP